MNTLRRIVVIVALVLIAVPLVIAAQDNNNPPPIEIVPADPCPGCIEYPYPNNINENDIPTPQATLMLPGGTSVPWPPQSPTEELIEYPVTHQPQDPCVDDDPDDLLLPLCLPTSTPRPQATPVSELPAIVNGLWILKPGSSGFSSSGTCEAEWGDNDGPPTYGSQDEIPRVPVCVSADNQWLSANSSSSFPRVLDGVYSTQAFGRELLTTAGVTSGSINVTTRREYRIISPTEIEFSFTIQEDGGCTRTSTLRYTMVEPNELVCSGVIITPEPTLMSTPVSTPQPDETPQVPPTPEPPIQPGRYVIELPVKDAACTPDVAPAADTVEMRYDDNANLFINFGGGSYTLYWDGADHYKYQEGNLFQISVITYDGGVSLAWSKRSRAGGDICYISSPLMVEGAPTPTPIAVEPTSEAWTDATALAGSTYSVTFDAPEYLCAPENLDTLPDLNAAVLTAQADGNFLFDVGSNSYILTNVDGIHSFMEMHDDGSMLSIGMNGFYEGTGMGNFSVIGADGAFCIAQLTFTPAG